MLYLFPHLARELDSFKFGMDDQSLFLGSYPAMPECSVNISYLHPYLFV